MSTRFVHSGAIGDLIYSLPTVRAMGGGEILLRRGHFHSFDGSFVTSAIEFLKAQPYVSDARVFAGETDIIDLDKFRGSVNICGYNLADSHLCAFNLQSSERDRAWLESPTFTRAAPVIIHRSPRFRNALFPWNDVVELYKGKLCMVGSPGEHQEFCATYGKIPYHKTNSLLELMSAIAGSEVFVGNQSAPFSIAEGLKKNVVLERCANEGNCDFDRPGHFGFVAGRELRFHAVQ